MNHLAARQRTGGRFDYTCRNDGRVYPVGYCAGFREFSEEERARYGMTDAWYAAHLALRHFYHEDGHPTPEDACACYKRYELDTSMRVGEDSRTQQKCEVCGVWTQKRVSVGGYSVFVLCDEHANREEVEKIYNVGESWES